MKPSSLLSDFLSVDFCLERGFGVCAAESVAVAQTSPCSANRWTRVNRLSGIILAKKSRDSCKLGRGPAVSRARCKISFEGHVDGQLTPTMVTRYTQRNLLGCFWVNLDLIRWTVVMNEPSAWVHVRNELRKGWLNSQHTLHGCRARNRSYGWSVKSRHNRDRHWGTLGGSVEGLAA